MDASNDMHSTSLTNLIGSGSQSEPIGIKLFGLCLTFNSTQARRSFHKTLVITLTFIAYAAFHAGRRPLSIVKNVLNRDGHENHTTSLNSISPHPSLTTLASNGSWAPFDDDATANRLLAYLDTAFLSSYAFCMFFSGMVAERVNLRYFVAAGAVLSGLGLVAFGLARSLEIHDMSYFVTIQIFSGAAQSIGWPVVVTCVSNWFEPAKRGLIYGIWNSHTSLGNILGATMAGYFVERNWGLSFIVPGLFMIVVGVILFLFLAPTPADVGLSARIAETDPEASRSKQTRGLEISMSTSVDQVGVVSGSAQHSKAVPFLTALKIPGVIEYSLCLFFSKLVSYTFLYWLPRYITSSTTLNSEDSAYLSTPFDIGGILGAILAGHLSDIWRVNGTICNLMLLLAIPSMFAYETFGSISNIHNIILQLITGLLVNGPYCLITTAVSADLGNRIKDGRAMATVSAIIDGMGSIGAVLGPLFAGLVSESGSWQSVFIMLMLSDVFASVCLLRVTINEMKSKLSAARDSGETLGQAN